MYRKLESKEDILKVARTLVKEKGFQALSIRSLAEVCEVSVGTIYNYFPSKQELIIEVVEAVWRGIFHENSCDFRQVNFIDTLKWFENCLSLGAKEFPDFLSTHHHYFAIDEKSMGRKQMEDYFSHIQQGMLFVLDTDQKIEAKLLENDIEKRAFIEFVMVTIIDLVLSGKETTILFKMILAMIN